MSFLKQAGGTAAGILIAVFILCVVLPMAACAGCGIISTVATGAAMMSPSLKETKSPPSKTSSKIAKYCSKSTECEVAEICHNNMCL